MKIGIGVPDFKPSQLAYSLTNEANSYLASSKDVDIVGFFEQASPFWIEPNFCTMQIHEAWGYDGIFVATNVNIASKCLAFPANKKKFFYLWDLEWIHRKNEDFSIFSKVYQNPDMKLIARSKQHADVIKQTWNKTVCAVVKEFNIKELVDICNN